MGVAGTGKSTVAGLLADHLRWELQEGDDLHPPANVAKMSAGILLTDEDRRPWLDASLHAGVPSQLEAGNSGAAAADENVLEVNLGATPAEEVAEVLRALEGKIKPSANPTSESQQDSA